MTRPWVLFFEQLASAATGAATPLEVALPDGSGTTTISSAAGATEGALLAVTIEQGATTGGHQIAWSSQFASGTSVDIPMLPGERVKKLFIGLADGKWHDFAQLS